MNPRVIALSGLALLSACGGSVGVIEVVLVGEPASAILSNIERVRLELDNPPAVAEATRTPGGGLVLDLEVPSTSGLGQLQLEAFDAAGALIGVAASGPLPVNSIDGVLTLYVAPPLSVGAAPVAFDSARDAMATATLAFGPIFLGGIDASGQALTDVVVYNVYDHAFQIGAALENPRSDAAAFASDRGVVYILGGRNGGAELASPVAFDTNIAPSGSYFDIAAPAGLERAGEQAASLGGELGVVSGSPPVRIDGGERTAAVFDEGPDLFGTITTSLRATGAISIAVGLGTGSSGAAEISSTSVTELAGPAELVRRGHCAAAAAGGDIYIIGGLDASDAPLLSGLHFRAATGDFVVIADLLDEPRIDAALAVTDRYLVIVGGADEFGVVRSDAVILDIATLGRVATLPLAGPRRGATAITLANQQVLIAGGRDDALAPTERIELFTPDLP